MHKAYTVISQQTNTNTDDSNNKRNPNVGRGRGRGHGGFGCRRDRGGEVDYGKNTSIAKSLFERKLNDGWLHKLTITEGLYWATQLKQFHDILPILCVEKGYKYLNNVVYNNQELVKATHMPA